MVCVDVHTYAQLSWHIFDADAKSFSVSHTEVMDQSLLVIHQYNAHNLHTAKKKIQIHCINRYEGVLFVS